MIARIRPHLSFANLLACLALFIALGGASYAAISVPRNSVGSRQLKAGAVTSAKVKDRSLLARDFKAGQLRPGPRGAQGPAGPSTGPAGGALSGSYPSPGLANGAVGPGALAAWPAARVSLALDEAVPTATPTALAWDTESFDTAGLFSTGDTTHLVAPRDGLYEVTSSIDFEATGGNQRLVRLAINDSASNFVALTEVAPKATGGTAISAAGLVKLASGDKISAVVAQDSGGAMDINGGTTFLAMRWAGPAS